MRLLMPIALLLSVASSASAAPSSGGASDARRGRPAEPGAATPAVQARGPRQIDVIGPRIRFGDIAPDAEPGTADVDLGPVPAPGGSRVLERAEIAYAIREQTGREPKQLPEAVRIARRMKRLGASELERVVREAVAAAKLPKGASLGSVRPVAALEVPDGWTRVDAAIPLAPRRSGRFATTATISFIQGSDVLARANVPVELSLSAEASVPDAKRGAALVLLVKRGLVEVTVAGVAGADADVGDVVPVLLRPSGRVVRARLVEKDRAVALEDR